MIIQKKLNSHELNAMTELMSDAFLNHENFLYLIPQKQRRKKATYSLFKTMFKVINNYGYIFVVYENDEIAGYITYMDESKYSINLKTIVLNKGLFDSMKFLYLTGIKNLMKFNQYLKLYNKHIQSSNKAIHLYSTGVSNKYRGRGIMKKSFLESFQYFKKIGYFSITLETSDKKNIMIYDKLDFSISEIIESENKSQRIYFFERDL